LWIPEVFIVVVVVVAVVIVIVAAVVFYNIFLPDWLRVCNLMAD
jgi:hypothetical protein